MPKLDDTTTNYAALDSPRAVDTQASAPTTEQSHDALMTRSRDDEQIDVPGNSAPNGSTDNKNKKAPLWTLYRFATPWEIVMLVTACVCACVNGVLYPCMALVYGHAIGAFDPFDKHDVNIVALEFLGIAIALLVTDYLSFSMFGSLSERQTKIMRETVFLRLLGKDIEWYDMNSNNVLQLSSRITSETIMIKNGMGPKLGDSIKLVGQCVGGFVIGFVQSWDLALVMSCVAPLSMWSMTMIVSTTHSLAKTTQDLYAEAGAIAEETISSMRTVVSLNSEKLAIDRFDAKSQTIEEATITMFRRVSVVQEIFTSSVWLMYAIGLWYGGRKVWASEMPPGTVFQAFIGITLGTWSLGQISQISNTSM